MPEEATRDGAGKKEFDAAKYDRLVNGLYDSVRNRLSGSLAMQRETLDGRQITAIPSKELAKALVDARAVDGDTTAGLWAELQWNGFNTADRGVNNSDFTTEGHATLVSRRAEVMDALCKRLKLDHGYSDLKDGEREVYLEANFVALLSELAHAFYARVDVLEKELKICKGTK